MHVPAARGNRLADAPIYAKVGLAPGLILLVLLLLSVASLRMLDAGEARLVAISDQAFPSYQRAAETKDAINAIQTALQHTLSVAANESDPARIQKVAAPVRAAITRGAAALQRLDQQIGAHDETVLASDKSFQAYQAAAIEVLDTAASDAATASMLMSDADEAFATLSAELDGHRSRAEAASQSMSREAVRAAGSERLLLLVGVALAFVVCTAIMITISRAIGRPIVRLTAVMTAMAGDNLEQEIPDLRRGDEIGAMARAVDVFRGNGRQARQFAMERAREQAARQQRHSAMERHAAGFGTSISAVMTSLGGSAEGVRHAAATMTGAANQVYGKASTTADSAAKASLDLASVAGAIEQMTASVAEISRQVAASATIAREAVLSARSGQDTMRAMAEAASRIGEVVRLISAIARQTNMLALNATIEAARAGEAGRGFAVVAGEVKTLAARTAKATSDIEGQIAAVSGSTEAALAAMVEVSAVIGKMDQVSAAIAAAVEQQRATTREVAVSLQAVAAATDQTAHAMQEVAGVAENAGAVSRTVLESANAIGQESEKLRREVGDFLTAIQDDATTAKAA